MSSKYALIDSVLQQHLPFTVLKLPYLTILLHDLQLPVLQQHLPFTVLKPRRNFPCIKIQNGLQQHLPFTVLKQVISWIRSRNSSSLQQHLPFTVLKLCINIYRHTVILTELQQHLPFTVLKRTTKQRRFIRHHRCNSAYRLRY